MRGFQIFTLSLLFIFTGCITPTPKQLSKKEITINGKIFQNIGDTLTIETEKKLLSENSYEDTIGNKIIRNSLFTKDMDLFIQNQKFTVRKVSGDKIALSKSDISPHNIKIKTLQKKVAVINFPVADEDLAYQFSSKRISDKLKKSGYFQIIEEWKVKKVIVKQNLISLGDISGDTSSKIGRDLEADIVVSGKIRRKCSNWIVEIRIVDVKTKSVISDLEDKIKVKEFNPAN
ncbi:MAG: DUF3280 domain-containing protein [Campylobacterales bacterium]|nr:DUF3280 domain-containing protein [Campylobacterales bacterium]